MRMQRKHCTGSGSNTEKENKLMQYGGSILSNLSAHYLAGNDFSTLAGLGLAVFGRADRPQC